MSGGVDSGSGGYRGGQQDCGVHGRGGGGGYNPEAVEVAMEVEVAWAEVTVVASINLVVLGIKDLVMILNRIIRTTILSSFKA